MEDHEIRILILEILKETYNENPHDYMPKATILNNIKIPSNELERNILYLEDKGLIDVLWALGGHFHVRINSFGIDELERIKNELKDEDDIHPEPVIISIIDEIKEFVDSNLENINPDILTKLNYIYEDLLTRDHPHNYARIAFDCREILMDFTDAIFNEDSLKYDKKPRRIETKNKIYFTLRELTESETDSKVISERFEYIKNYFSAFNDFVQKNSHPDGFEVKEEDAKACVIYTYLFINDILKIIESYR